jgi:hypothetical protein
MCIKENIQVNCTVVFQKEGFGPVVPCDTNTIGIVCVD